MSATLLSAWAATLSAAPDARALLDAASGRAWTRAQIETADATKGVAEHVELELSLIREVRVSEVRAAGTVLGGDPDVRRRPHVRTAMGRRLEHLESLGAPEGCVPRLRETRPHPLARQRIRHEDHPALVPPHEDAAVRDPRHLEVDEVAGLHAIEHRIRRRPG